MYTPDDKAVQTPNSDTPYSHAGLDLRSEPIVLTVPVIETNRYFSVQLVDAYTHNFSYIGTRATGNSGGRFLTAGPDWKGEKLEGIEAVIQSETEFVLAWYRTQLINPADLDNITGIQAGYQVQTLSEFLRQPAARHAPNIDFLKPLTRNEQLSSPEFFNNEPRHFVFELRRVALICERSCPCGAARDCRTFGFASTGGNEAEYIAALGTDKETSDAK